MASEITWVLVGLAWGFQIGVELTLWTLRKWTLRPNWVGNDD